MPRTRDITWSGRQRREGRGEGTMPIVERMNAKILLNKLPQVSLIMALINLVLPSFTLFRTAGRNCGGESE
jgi:hypothetical protein